MWNVELKVPPNGCFAAVARAAFCLHSLQLARRPLLGQQNGSGCLFKTARGKLTARATGLITLTRATEGG
jgi:hypothetical protein